MREIVKDLIGKSIRTVTKPLQKVMANDVFNAEVSDFENCFAMEFREAINPLIRYIIGKKFVKRKWEVVYYPKLEPKKPYIFSPCHSFDEDISVVLATVDRNAYLLLGTENQIKVNPQVIGGWINGMIFVDRESPQSRSDALAKMENVIRSGRSIIIYPEGYLNNTESVPVQPLFSGVYKLSSSTKTDVVPVSPFNEFGSNQIIVEYGDPINFIGMSEKEGLIYLRDIMATLKWLQMEEFTKPLLRENIGVNSNHHIDFMEQRRQVYLKTYWDKTESLLKEINQYVDKRNPNPKDLWKSLSKVQLTMDNIHIMFPIIRIIEEYNQEDFYQYVKKIGISKNL